jgi:surfactin synthase thioesterase subunit
MRAILLHHAGGDKYAYRNYTALGSEVSTFATELPGRGDRFTEPLLDSMEAIVEDLLAQVKSQVGEPYVLVGKSMGALTGYLLMHRMMEAGLPLPMHVIFGSRKCPASYGEHVKIAHTDSKTFWKGVEAYGGCPPALLQHEELKELYEPILRADFKALEQYVHVQRPVLPVSATIWTGENDAISEEETYGWCNHFGGEMTFATLPGGHFFMYEQPERVAERIREVRAGLLTR